VHDVHYDHSPHRHTLTSSPDSDASVSNTRSFFPCSDTTVLGRSSLALRPLLVDTILAPGIILC